MFHVCTLTDSQRFLFVLADGFSMHCYGMYLACVFRRVECFPQLSVMRVSLWVPPVRLLFLYPTLLNHGDADDISIWPSSTSCHSASLSFLLSLSVSGVISMSSL